MPASSACRTRANPRSSRPPIHWTRPDGEGGAGVWEAPLKDEGDIDKLTLYLEEVAAVFTRKPETVDPELLEKLPVLLCKEREKITVEYALRDLKKPIGVAQWRVRLIESLPKRLQGQLPTVEEIEKELVD